MNPPYHIQITRDALAGRFDPAPLHEVIVANLKQDRLGNLIGHPEIHFDDSAFAAGVDYLNRQRQQAVEALVARDDPAAARAAFGRLLHGRQDFYAHSNWVQRWCDARGGAAACSPAEVEICPDPLAELGLISGVGSVRDFILVRIPLLGGWMERRFVSPISHERMNLDHPGRGPLFDFACQAAVKHSRIEMDTLLAQLPAQAIERFLHNSRATA